MFYRVRWSYEFAWTRPELFRPGGPGRYAAGRSSLEGTVLSTLNPWKAAQEEPPSDTGAGPPVTTTVITAGPQAPQSGVDAPDVVDRLPVRATEATGTVWWVGVHGGAGETTLTRLLSGSREGGQMWPSADAGQLPHAVVLVARSNWPGVSAALQTCRQWAAGDVVGARLIGMVVVADSSKRPPRPVRELEEKLAGAVPRFWRLPWVELWRASPPSAPEDAPPTVQKVVAEIAAAVTDPHPDGGTDP